MADIMRPVPFGELLGRIAGEFRNHGSIFNIDSAQFYHDAGKKRADVFSSSCTMPLGPAAGPHTQLAQNIITSYLCGARFIELKTVQIMDTLEIAKPCIDARDEGYNVEWSTEFTLEKAYDEYLKAWIILHIIEGLMNGKMDRKPSFIFNMSVGYNLEGIKSERMRAFIDDMIECHRIDFGNYIAEAQALLEDNIFEGTEWEGAGLKIAKHLDVISPRIASSVTISTMHGCPPDEIERICSYMISEKHIDTFVKLNPTLLGYDTVRKILDDHGFDYIVLNRDSFSHDLQKADALPMLERLKALAAENGVGFGVKLTNTLGTGNDGKVIPGNEKYMSGRALFLVSVRVAEMIASHFDGNIMISYSGGLNAANAALLFDAGIRPLTLATDMLRPGGYARMSQIASIIAESDNWDSSRIDLDKLREAIAIADESGHYEKDFRGTDSVKIGTPLSLTDCFVAPCVEACPINQDIPDYVALAGEGRWAEAFGLIYLKNALPSITGWICDHQCQNHCARMDYEGAVQIREIKKLAVENGYEEFRNEIWEKPEAASEKAAVIGAGPAGLSAAYFLARAGFDTYVFEREENAGGVVRNIIPDFRIPEEAIEHDVKFIEDNGVKFFFRTEKTVAELKAEGFGYIFVSIGAEKSRDPGIKGNGPVESAIHFLARAKRKEAISLGRNVAVIGGGNTAMDAARMAKRIPGVESVTVIYRRTRSEMPADMEEYKEALEEDIQFMFLHNPSSFQDGQLTVAEMELGEEDESGRRRPVDTGRTAVINIDYVISAIGESADKDVLKAICGTDTEGVYLIGDAATGPSTVVRCIASARAAVEDAIDDVYSNIAEEDEDEDECCCGHDDCGCGHHHEHGDECGCGHHHHDDDCDCGHDHDEEDDDEMTPEEEEEMRLAEDEFFASIVRKKSHLVPRTKSSDEFFALSEASRCIECSYLCLKCMEVCPNRANVAIDLRDTGLFEDPFQIVHLDAYCNECGNCETFCPHSGKPYRDKFTLFSLYEDFENSTNSGFYPAGDEIYIRLDGKVIKGSIDGDGYLEADVPVEIAAIIERIYMSYSYLLGAVEE